jgi:hypothetical protein
VSRGEAESRVRIDPEKVQKIIPHDFPNIEKENDPEKVSENKNDKKQLETLRKELENLKRGENNQTNLKAIRFNSLLVLRQFKGQFAEKEYQNYEEKINTAPSREVIEIVVKEILQKVKQKNSSPRPTRENEDKKTKDKLAEIERQNKILTGQLQLNNGEMEKLKREIHNLQKQGNKDKILSIIVIIILII